ncbi:transcription factor [Ganoderma sinense ZZ0214-1]|uniref:Transcription factor n=1 Tax=Ganoderma sinense ZZ0214-1 TaxID=1077348 RepID=A0A2G8RV26_9APHY|nr:transcription factor [Ganoderma sinense ZZ0214-1]
MQRLERLFSKLNPDVDIEKELDGGLSDQESGPSTNVAPPASPPEPPKSEGLRPPMATGPSPSAVSDNLDPSDDESEVQKNVVEIFDRLSLNPMTYRYHGKSSGLIFLRAAQHIKDQVETDSDSSPATTPEQPALDVRQMVRRQFATSPWLWASLEDSVPPFKDFPPQDLMDTLVEYYFRELNDYFPLLHEPTFKQCIQSGFHRHHGAFGATVLLVCANAARFSDDPRVLWQGTDNRQSAGWKWFEMVERVHKSFIAYAHVYDLQIRVLLISYLQCSAAPHACWTHIGLGVRTGIDIGAHRKRMYGAIPTIEQELMRRAFWILVLMDWGAAYNTGRPTSIHDEDMDLGLPKECDDEYWISPDGEPLFRQPAGKPSKVSFFTTYIRLAQILAFAVRTIYSINKSKSVLGNGDRQWEQRIVAELDSALNKWVDSVPAHLQWNPDREDHLLLKQSAILLSHYYQIQMAVHRPFISTRRQSSLMFPSLIICTNAARSAVRVVSDLYERTGDPSYKNVSSLFMSSVVLLLYVWGEKKSGRTAHCARDIEYVKKCMEMIKVCERHLILAERLSSTLNELVCSGTPLDAYARKTQPRGSDAEVSQPPSLPSSSSSEDTSLSEPSWDHHFPTENPSIASSTGDHSIAPSTFQDFGAMDPRNFVAMFGTPVATDEGASFKFSHPLHTEQLAIGYGQLANGYAALSMDDGWQQPPQPGSFPPQNPAAHFGAPQHSLGQHMESVNTEVQDPLVDTGMFGLEPMGYSHAASMQPIAASTPTSHYQAQFAQGIASARASGSNGTGDFAFSDDSLSVWTNAPMFYG